jgi:pimeloyl-ACP methyl ester carboxylesterase
VPVRKLGMAGAYRFARRSEGKPMYFIRKLIFPVGLAAVTLSAWCQTAVSPSEYRYSGSFFAPEVRRPRGGSLQPRDETQLCYTFNEANGQAASISVGRVVATSSTDIDSTGTLLNAPALVSNHIISQQATLTVTYVLYSDPAAPPPPGPATIQVVFNGQSIGTISAPFASAPQSPPLVAVFPFDIGLVRFALKGTPPTPGSNAVSLANNSGSCIAQPPDLPFGVGPHGRLISATLSFKALSPVLMVHGYNEGPEWFGPPLSNQCIRSGFNFFQAFDQAKVPYDYQEINLGDSASIQVGGANLAKAVATIAAEFGAKHVHLIGHSKGGLFIRQYLPNATDGDIGVFSVTTLDTPHHGSYGADVAVYSRKLFGLTFLLNFLSVPQFIGALFAKRAGAEDLTVANMNRYNARNPLPPTFYTVDGVVNSASFYSTASDADLDDDGTIETNEVIPYRRCIGNTTPYTGDGTPFSDLVNTLVFNGAYQSMRRFQMVQLALGGILADNVDNTQPQQNDFVVTTASATYNSFQPISSGGSDVLKYNHKSVGNPDPVGMLVIQKIHLAEPIQ